MERYRIRVRTLGGTWTSLEQRAQLGEWTGWVDVTEAEWMEAERLAGLHTQHPGRRATSGFSTKYVEGRMFWPEEGDGGHAEVDRLGDLAGGGTA